MKTLLYLGCLLFAASSCLIKGDKLPLPNNPETCYDGILNQSEVTIDCGGPCRDCYKEPDCLLSANIFELENDKMRTMTSKRCEEKFNGEFNATFYIDYQSYGAYYGILSITLSEKPQESTLYSISSYPSNRYSAAISYSPIADGAYIGTSGILHVKVDGDYMEFSFCDISFGEDAPLSGKGSAKSYCY